ncbi:hypothetical protein, partial [Brunnivagina elsteri]|uniref:hypothetical protein n=1 Tax=Brunnivagina elsteri TaxID=1247191 RepID=UPI001B8079C4
TRTGSLSPTFLSMTTQDHSFCGLLLKNNKNSKEYLSVIYKQSEAKGTGNYQQSPMPFKSSEALHLND